MEVISQIPTEKKLYLYPFGWWGRGVGGSRKHVQRVCRACYSLNTNFRLMTLALRSGCEHGTLRQFQCTSVGSPGSVLISGYRCYTIIRLYNCSLAFRSALLVSVKSQPFDHTLANLQLIHYQNYGI